MEVSQMMLVTSIFGSCVLRRLLPPFSVGRWVARRVMDRPRVGAGCVSLDCSLSLCLLPLGLDDASFEFI